MRWDFCGYCGSCYDMKRKDFLRNWEVFYFLLWLQKTDWLLLVTEWRPFVTSPLFYGGSHEGGSCLLRFPIKLEVYWGVLYCAQRCIQNALSLRQPAACDQTGLKRRQTVNFTILPQWFTPLTHLHAFFFLLVTIETSIKAIQFFSFKLITECVYVL